MRRARSVFSASRISEATAAQAKGLRSIAGNTAKGVITQGGGIYALDSIVELTACSVIGNKSLGADTGEGGGFYIDGSVLLLASTTVIGNVATTSGPNFYFA